MVAGMQEKGGGGPAARQLYDSHSGAADLGHAKAAELDAYKMSQQQKFAVPVGAAGQTDPGSAPEWYNMNPIAPAKYDLPSQAKEHMQAKDAVRRAAGTNTGAQVIRTDPITEEEVSYTMAMKRQAELASFDRYVNMLVDPKKPGNLKWLMEVYPEFVHRRIAQVHDDFDFAIRNQMIDQWGINTLDDLHFKYLVDQGKISGGKLGVRRNVGQLYEVGSLAPWASKILAGQTNPDTSGDVRMPYWSERDRAAGDMVQEGRSQPLGQGGRDYLSLARNLYRARTDGNVAPSNIGGSSAGSGLAGLTQSRVSSGSRI